MQGFQGIQCLDLRVENGLRRPLLLSVLSIHSLEGDIKATTGTAFMYLTFFKVYVFVMER